jgi:hypothetical protein
LGGRARADGDRSEIDGISDRPARIVSAVDRVRERQRSLKRAYPR